MTIASEFKNQLLGFFEEARVNYEHIFLVDFVKNPKTNDYTFVVDGETPVELSQIAHISRLISRQIDENIDDETAFKFQVSTPGADKPLVLPKQYIKHIGRTLQCVLNNEEEIEGKLMEATEKGITIETKEDKKKKIEPVTHIFEFTNIKEAKIKLEF